MVLKNIARRLISVLAKANITLHTLAILAQLQVDLTSLQECQVTEKDFIHIQFKNRLLTNNQKNSCMSVPALLSS